MRMLIAAFRPALLLLFFLTLLLGGIYPAVVTGLAQLVFAEKAQGSLVRLGDRVVGSSLLGQEFDDPRYFWGRISATAGRPYNPMASGGSNLSPANPALLEQVKKRLTALKKDDPKNTTPVPVDLVTSSASGLDPHISPAAAEYQVRRVARVRKMSEGEVRSLVAQHVEDRQFGLFGEPRVNVLKLNMMLDQSRPQSSSVPDNASKSRPGKKR